jgi:hypothetical protein
MYRASASITMDGSEASLVPNRLNAHLGST